MKILHIDETFHPSFGYHTNPLAKYQVQNGFDVTILTVDEDHLYPVFKEFSKDESKNLLELDKIYSEKTGVTIVRTPVKKYFSNRAIYEKSIFKKIDEINPDIIYVHLLESYISMRMILKIRKKYPMIFDSHMLAVASKNRFKKIYELGFRNILSRIIRRNNFKVIRTQNDDYIINHLGVPENLSPYISFGTDTLHFYPSLEIKKEMRKSYSISDDALVIVYTGKITEEKGLDLFAEAIEKKFNQRREIVFLVVGNSSGEFGINVETIFSNSKNRIIRVPIQDYLSLPQFYQIADIAIFPKQNSMSFYDAQACGLPVILEENELNKKRVSFENGFTYSENSIDSLRKVINDILLMENNVLESMSLKSVDMIEKEYSYNLISKQYDEVIISEYKRQSKKG